MGHILWWCLKAREVWECSKLVLSKVEGAVLSFQDIMWKLLMDRGVARIEHLGGPSCNRNLLNIILKSMKVEIDDNEYHHCMDNLYFQVDMDLL